MGWGQAYLALPHADCRRQRQTSAPLTYTGDRHGYHPDIRAPACRCFLLQADPRFGSCPSIRAGLLSIPLRRRRQLAARAGIQWERIQVGRVGFQPGQDREGQQVRFPPQQRWHECFESLPTCGKEQNELILVGTAWFVDGLMSSMCVGAILAVADGFPEDLAIIGDVFMKSCEFLS